MHASLRFRQYEETDQDAVWEIFDACSRQLGFATGPWDDDMRTIPRSYLATGGFLVGELAGRLVAHAAYRLESDGRAVVRRVAVHPDVQRQGIGQSLMTALEAAARQAGVTVLHLDASQPAAHALYRACGYREVGHVVQGGIACTLYEKSL